MNVVSVPKHSLVLVYMTGSEGVSFIIIFTTEGGLIAAGVSTDGIRLLSSDPRGRVTILREDDDAFTILRYSVTVPQQGQTTPCAGGVLP